MSAQVDVDSLLSELDGMLDSPRVAERNSTGRLAPKPCDQSKATSMELSHAACNSSNKVDDLDKLLAELEGDHADHTAANRTPSSSSKGPRLNISSKQTTSLTTDLQTK